MADDKPNSDPVDLNTVWPPPPTNQFQPEEPHLSWWKSLYYVPSGPATTQEVTAWWQARRLRYNLLVFGCGIPSFFLYLFFLSTSGVLGPGDDPVEPMLLIIAPVVVPIAVNICYTFGVIAELLWRANSRDKTRGAGRLFMQLGVAFSMFVVFFPSAAWGVIWFWRIVLGHR